VSYILFI